MERRIYRLRTDRVLAGVASGVAKHFNTDPVLIRVLFVALSLVGGGGVLAYIIMWAIIPEEPSGFLGESGTTEPAFERSSAEFQANKHEKSDDNRNGSIMAGGILIVLGALFLADEFLPRFDFSKYWPLLLVAIGVLLLMNAGRKNNKS
jgi:phage shock protein C